MKEILSLSATQQARLIREREISSEELIQAHLDQIAQVNPAINATVEVLAEPDLHGSHSQREQYRQQWGYK